jgi:sRNA-binding regulator protein Hfq
MAHRSLNGNGHAQVDPPTDLPAGPTSPAHRIQNAWLRDRRGQAIAVRLGSGEVITGVLEGDDAFTLALRIPGFPATALVYKHSIEYLVPNPRS